MAAAEHYFFCSALIAVRLTPILIAAPIGMLKHAPILTRIALTISLAMIIVSWSPTQPQIENAQNQILSPATVANEVMLGVVMAFGIHSAIGAISAMGYIIDQQTGLAASAIFDPSSGQASSIISELLSMSAATMLFTTNSHHKLLTAFSELVTVIPPGSQAGTTSDLFSLIGVQFGLAFLLTSPVMIAVWLTDFCFALISRTAPQANIYFISIPIKLLVGTTTLAAVSEKASPIIVKMFDTAINMRA